jgi:hypothetical protein
MIRKHDRHHDHCEHDLAHCGKCDLAYCTKCSKEWGGECTRAHSPYWYVYPYTTSPGTAADITFTDAATVCSHAA